MLGEASLKLILERIKKENNYFYKLKLVYDK